MIKDNNKQTGAVSLFVVVFATLLITVVTVGFVRIMLQDQQQATSLDLSQSAYDSAQAGVEDAKRAMLRYQEICASGDEVACSDAANQINSSSCNEALLGLQDIDLSEGEVQVQTASNDSALDQAYTCVKVSLNTIDYLGLLGSNQSKIVPLKVSEGESFNRLVLQWFSAVDVESTGDTEVNLQSAASSTWPLLAQNSWPANRPAIMRTQLIQVGNSFRLSDFDGNTVNNSNTNTLFLYPSGTTGQISTNMDSRAFTDRDVRKTPTGAPLPIICSGDLSVGGYACAVELRLPEPIGGGDRTSFLRLTSIYNSSHYRITLFNNQDPINFNAVQPEVDSTGRASDLFRRIKARVELNNYNFANPEGAVDITGNICKDFLVTDNAADYTTANCTP